MSHTLASLHYHVVFATKHRYPYLTPEIEDVLYPYIAGIVLKRRGLLIEIGGVADHVHLLANFRPRFSVSEMLQNIKGGSSSWLNEQSLCPEVFAWQAGYCAFTVSESQIPVVRRYIRRQKEHHRAVSFQEELEGLLRRHRIPHDPQHLAPRRGAPE